MVKSPEDLINRENLKLHQVQLEIMQISLEIGNIRSSSIKNNDKNLVLGFEELGR